MPYSRQDNTLGAAVNIRDVKLFREGKFDTLLFSHQSPYPLKPIVDKNVFRIPALMLSGLLWHVCPGCFS